MFFLCVPTRKVSQGNAYWYHQKGLRIIILVTGQLIHCYFGVMYVAVTGGGGGARDY